MKLPSTVVFLLVLLMTCITNVKADLPVKKSPLRLPVPGFELKDMQGNSHRMKEYEGKTVIVNFWAVWCAPCRKEIPAMNRALAILKDENIVILGVNVGDPKENIEKFRKDYPMDFTVLMDADGAVSQNWQVTGFPTTFIVNPDGQIVYRVVGGREWDEASMLENVRSLSLNTN
jgi:peroxiredoxin